VLSKQKNKPILFILILTLLFSIVYCGLFFSPQKMYGETESESEDEISKNEGEISESGQFIRRDLYSNYLDENEGHPRPDHEIIIEGEDYTSVDEMEVHH